MLQRPTGSSIQVGVHLLTLAHLWSRAWVGGDSRHPDRNSLCTSYSVGRLRPGVRPPGTSPRYRGCTSVPTGTHLEPSVCRNKADGGGLVTGRGQVCPTCQGWLSPPLQPVPPPPSTGHPPNTHTHTHFLGTPSLSGGPQLDPPLGPSFWKPPSWGAPPPLLTTPAAAQPPACVTTQGEIPPPPPPPTHTPTRQTWQKKKKPHWGECKVGLG